MATVAPPRTCGQCGAPVEDGKYRCGRCRRSRRNNDHERRAAGLCISCGAPAAPFLRCERCRARREKRARERLLGVPVGEHWRLRDEAPDPGPPRLLRAELERRRAARERFSTAWRAAVDLVLELPGGEAWLVPLLETRACWKAAYENSGRRLALTLDLLDGEHSESATVDVLG